MTRLVRLNCDLEATVSGIGYCIQAELSCDVDLEDDEICEIRIYKLNVYDWHGDLFFKGGSEFLYGRDGMNAFIYDTCRSIISEQYRKEIFNAARSNW